MKKLIFAIFAIAALSTTRVSAQGCGGAPSEEGIKMFGFLQSQYKYSLTEPTTNTFSFERARIGAMGKIPYDFSYYLVLELSPFMSARPEDNSAYLLDAFITYDRFKMAKLSMGSFKTPFGMETNTPCNGLMTVYRSKATLQMVSPFRDLGLMLLGGDENTLVQYQLGLMNGSGLLIPTGKIDDKNRKKDVVGRFVVHPVDFLNVGGSFRYGYPGDNNNEATRLSLGLELKAKYSGFTLLSEFIYDEGALNDAAGGCSGTPVDIGKVRKGAYVSMAYMSKWNVEPVFMYDFFHSGFMNTSSGQDIPIEEKYNTLTFGLNYFFNDWTRLQVNYLYRAETLEQKNDEIVVQLQVKF
ncbi:MAG: hypothetical protein FD170_197 [Bacteroidetes bacterium]|nr:MAG: hypothetical protein FD170_197 [Bacteroidota bacterium]